MENGFIQEDSATITLQFMTIISRLWTVDFKAWTCLKVLHIGKNSIAREIIKLIQFFFWCFHHFLWRNCYKGNPQKFIENKLIKNEWKTLIGERTSWNTIPWNFKKIFSTKDSFQCYPPGHRTQIEHKEDVPQTFQLFNVRSNLRPVSKRMLQPHCLLLGESHVF